MWGIVGVFVWVLLDGHFPLVKYSLGLPFWITLRVVWLLIDGNLVDFGFCGVG